MVAIGVTGVEDQIVEDMNFARRLQAEEDQLLEQPGREVGLRQEPKHHDYGHFLAVDTERREMVLILGAENACQCPACGIVIIKGVRSLFPISYLVLDIL